MIGITPRNNPHSNAVSAMLAEIRDKRIARFDPIINPERGLTYSGFSNQDFAEQKEILKSLSSLGILKEEPFDYVRICSHCDHHDLLVKMACPACSSTNTIQGKVVEHLKCGNIDLESKFISDGAAGLICAKCKKRLRAIGVDYVRPGSYCLCLSCNALSPEGRMQFVCVNCARSLTRDELDVQPLPAYVVDAEALAAHLGRSGQEFQGSVIRSLEKLGLRALSNATIAGASQVQHVFDIVVYERLEPADDMAEIPTLVVEIKQSETRVEPEAALNFFAKCMDVRGPKKLLVGIPGIADETRKLADAYGIGVLEQSGADAQELAGRIAASLPVQESEHETHEEGSVTNHSDLEKMIKAIISTSQEDNSGQDVN